jgi:hypothetical protein
MRMLLEQFVYLETLNNNQYTLEIKSVVGI